VVRLSTILLKNVWIACAKLISYYFLPFAVLKSYYLYVYSENEDTNRCVLRIITSYNTSLSDAEKLVSDFKKMD
jgi:hypothetical protein